MKKAWAFGTFFLITFYYLSGCSTNSSKLQSEPRPQVEPFKSQEVLPPVAGKKPQSPKPESVRSPEFATQPNAISEPLDTIQIQSQQRPSKFFTFGRVNLIWFVIVNLIWFILGTLFGFFSRLALKKNSQSPAHSFRLEALNLQQHKKQA